MTKLLYRHIGMDKNEFCELNAYIRHENARIEALTALRALEKEMSKPIQGIAKKRLYGAVKGKIRGDEE